MRGAAALLIAAALTAGPAAAGPEQGRSLASRRCAACHAISGPGPSPIAKAPPFERIAPWYPPDDAATARLAAIVAGHGEVLMPEVALRPSQLDDLLAYLSSLRG